MSSLYLQQVFWILVGVTVSAGIIRGVHHAVKRILGYSNDVLFGTPEKMANLGIIPVFLLEAGCFIMITRFFAENIPEADFLVIGTGGVLALGHIMIRKTGRKLPLVIVDGIIGGIATLVVSEISGKIIGGVLVGMIIGSLEILIIRLILERSPDERGDVFPFWIAAWLMGSAVGGAFPEISSDVIVWVSILAIWIVFLVAVMFRHGIALLVDYTGKVVSFFLSSLLILLRFRTIHCNHCLRYTHPFRSHYNLGLRYCEHCFQRVEHTKDPGKVIFTFGDVLLLEPEDRVFIFFNADVEQQDKPIDVSEVYIDTKTCDIRLIERFVTYLLHDPPEQGVQSVKIFYSGELDDLGVNLKNVLQNNFISIQAFHPTPQSKDMPEKQPASFSYFPEHENWGQQIKLLGGRNQKSTPPPLPKTDDLKVRFTEGSIGGIIGLIWGLFSGFLIFIGFPAAFDLEPLRFNQPFVQGWLAFSLISWIILSWLSGIKKGLRSDTIPVWVIVSLVLCIVVNIALPGFITAANRSKVNQTAAIMRAIGTALGSYQVDFNYFPVYTGDWDIDRVIPEEYYLWETKDAWGTPFYYDCKDGTWDDNGYSGYTLISYGKDRKPGGSTEFDSDIIYINGRFIRPESVVRR